MPGLATAQTPPPHVPCTNRDPLRKPLFGETHSHTAYSFDAYSLATKNPPSDAYRYAKGEAITIADAQGNPTRCAQLAKPLDWAAITDHSEFLGEVWMCTTPSAPEYNSQSCVNYRANGETEANAWGGYLSGYDPPKHPPFCGTNGETCRAQATNLWRKIQDEAEGAYDRTEACRFTSFVAYEWTSMPGNNNRHRNVIFRNEAVPALPISVIDSTNDERTLWSRLRSECLNAGTGCDVLTIPHNGNLSNGKLYELPTGADLAYAVDRSTWEPLSEIHQGKGNSECRTGVGTTDSECGFEQLAFYNLEIPPSNPGTSFVPNAFLRNVLKDGLAQEKRLGANPFKLGFAGGTDTHSALPGGTDEGNFMGIHGSETADDEGLLSQVYFNAGALTVAWAEENTREAIFAALKRRETYATSGTRPIVRFFAGWDLPADLCSRQDFVSVGYAQGVPMGSDLKPRPNGSTQGPRFAVMAMKDPAGQGNIKTCAVSRPGALLQRIEIVKGWLDTQGNTHEQVVTVAGSPNLDPGATVNTATCEPVGPGSSTLCNVWTDPNFDPALPAFYYARVLENPSCRWSTYTCKNAGLDPFNSTACNEKLATITPEGSRQIFSICCTMQQGPVVQPTQIPRVAQQRAWTSPVWYTPAPGATATTSAGKR